MLDNSKYMFKKRENVADIEEGSLLSPKFDNDCLLYTSPSPRDS